MLGHIPVETVMITWFVRFDSDDTSKYSDIGIEKNHWLSSALMLFKTAFPAHLPVRTEPGKRAGIQPSLFVALQSCR